MSARSLPNFEEILREFLDECGERLEQLDIDLVAWENDPSNGEVLSRILRVVHTIKGNSGVLGFPVLERLTHDSEDLLCGLRDRGQAPDAEVITILLDVTDALRVLLGRLGATGGEEEGEVPGGVREGLAAALRRLGLGCGELEEGDGESGGESEVDVEGLGDGEVESGGGELEEGGGWSGGDRTIRVDIELLEALLDQVGELVLTRNRIQQLAEAERSAPMLRVAARLGQITEGLHERVMKARMRPIASLWGKLPRVVRDVAQRGGKQVGLVSEGGDTELDRAVLEAFDGPLVHLVRNAVDHGIESAVVRRGLGKPEKGTISLRASHEGGFVLVEVADDGGGVDTAGLVSRAGVSVEGWSEREVLELMFEPGLSTASAVTDVSGRGVGMDVVRTEVERIGGHVEVHSTLGVGTRFVVRVPLTLAIVPALLVGGASGVFAVPQANLLELVLLERGLSEVGVERLGSTYVYRLRDQLLPLVDLGVLLGLESERGEGETRYVVVLHAEGRPFGLLVDEVEDTEDIVVKPLGPLLQGIPVYSGATVLGDGRVALIMDVARVGREVREVDEEGIQTAGRLEEEREVEVSGRELLVFRSASEQVQALDLRSVGRLEELEVGEVERAGPGWMMRHGARLVPLVFLSELLEEGSGCVGVEGRDTLQVVIYEEGSRLAGFVVDDVLDVVEERLEVVGPSSRPGVSATAVVQGRVTELLDVEWLLERAEIS